MNIEPTSKFTPKVESVDSLLRTAGMAFYIPGYQRPYSWDKDDIERVFQDTVYGIRSIENQPDSINFIGSIIGLNDTAYEEVQPVYHSEMPSKVFKLIDGQQRVSTYIMINIAMHNAAKLLFKKFDKKTDPQFAWIQTVTKKIFSDLQDTFAIENSAHEEIYRYYPKVIRGYEDAWSTNKSQALYESPIAKLIWTYLQIIDAGEADKKFNYQKDSFGKSIPDNMTSTVTAFTLIQNQIAKITSANNNEELALPTPEELVSNQWSKAIFNYSIQDGHSDFYKYIIEGHEDSAYRSACELLRLLVLDRYLRQRMVLIRVEATGLDDAFDIFEALNTTGEPLTAYETFKPKIIEAESSKSYKSSPSYSHVKKIEQYLNKFGKADEKTKKSAEFIVWFVLSERGIKQPKSLASQRKQLRNDFSDISLSTIEEKRCFVGRMAGLADFAHRFWEFEDITSLDIFGTKIDNETGFSLSFLRKLSHSIVIPLLTRFYQTIIEADEEKQDQAISDLQDAIKACTAFSVLWRAAKGGALSIDDKYRMILRDKVHGKYGPMCARPVSGVSSVSLNNLKKAFIEDLKTEKIYDRDSWIAAVKTKPIFNQKEICRFVLFAASQDTVPDTSKPGHLNKGRSGSLDIMTPDNWVHENFGTVEHIAPRNINTKYDATIYSDPDTVHKLGNLTLLPMKENSVVSDREWDVKRIFYKMLSAEDETEFNTAKSALNAAGATLSETAEQIVDASNYLPLCKAIAMQESAWDNACIDNRSDNLAGLAWDRLILWLQTD